MGTRVLEVMDSLKYEERTEWRVNIWLYSAYDPVLG